MAEVVPERDAPADGATELMTSDGLRLQARTWLCRGAARAMVVLVHGFSAGKDERNVVALAVRLRDAGFDVIAYDARGHGESEGTCTLGYLEDATWPPPSPGPVIGPTRIVLVGASMGGVAVLRHAASGADVAGVVVVSSPYEWRMPAPGPGHPDRGTDPHQARPMGVGPADAGADRAGVDGARAAPCAGAADFTSRWRSSTASGTGSSRRPRPGISTPDGEGRNTAAAGPRHGSRLRPGRPCGHLLTRSTGSWSQRPASRQRPDGSRVITR